MRLLVNILDHTKSLKLLEEKIQKLLSLENSNSVRFQYWEVSSGLMSHMSEIGENYEQEVQKFCDDCKKEGTPFELSKIQVYVWTANPEHKRELLFFKSELADTRIQALSEVLEYILEKRRTEDNYIVEWHEIGEPKTNTSYFSAKSPQEALLKLYSAVEDYDLIKFQSMRIAPIS